MKYLALIYGDAERWDAMDEGQQEAMRGQYRAFAQEAGQRGALVDGFELEPSSTATTLRSGDNGPIVTDGPFAETKEQLGGYYLIEADSLDDAIEWATKLPGSHHGTVEIRAIAQVPAGAPS